LSSYLGTSGWRSFACYSVSTNLERRTTFEQAWDEEIRARVKAVDEGRANGIPYEEIKNELAGRFGPG
jgi:hypothetical protein